MKKHSRTEAYHIIEIYYNSNTAQPPTSNEKFWVLSRNFLKITVTVGVLCLSCVACSVIQCTVKTNLNTKQRQCRLFLFQDVDAYTYNNIDSETAKGPYYPCLNITSKVITSCKGVKWYQHLKLRQVHALLLVAGPSHLCRKQSLPLNF